MDDEQLSHELLLKGPMPLPNPYFAIQQQQNLHFIKYINTLKPICIFLPESMAFWKLSKTLYPIVLRSELEPLLVHHCPNQLAVR